MTNYAKALPRDKAGGVMEQHPAPFTSLQRFRADSTTSSVVTLSADTTALKVATVGGAGIVFKWISSTDTVGSVVATGATANFDHFVPGNNVRRFVVPIEKTVGVTSLQGANPQNGLYSRIAWVAAALPPSSVLSTEF